jgi:hypothetical protein
VLRTEVPSTRPFIPSTFRILNPYRRPFKTRDGYMAILPYTDQNWRDFFALTGRQDLLDDPRYKTLASRLKNIEALYEELGRIATTRTNAEWLAELDRRNIPAMSVNSLESLLHDPHLEAVGFWQTVEHPTEGTMRLPGIPAVYGKTVACPRAWASTASRSCARSVSPAKRSTPYSPREPRAAPVEVSAPAPPAVPPSGEVAEGHGCSESASEAARRLFRLLEPESHAHLATQRRGGREMVAGFFALADPSVELAEAEVTACNDRTHSQLAGEAHGLSI